MSKSNMPGSNLLLLIQPLFVQAIQADKKIVIAYSGGSDSTCLLHLAKCFSDQYDTCQVSAIHVNHHWSALSDRWQKHCEETCLAWGVPLIVAHASVQDPSRNIEQQARQSRWQAFDRSLGLDDQVCLMLAHHQQDQIETLIQRLFRGGGVHALAGIPRVRKHNHYEVCRPLLGITKAMIDHYIEDKQLTFVDDPSNHDTQLTRNYIRHQLLPSIEQVFPGINESLLSASLQLNHDHRVMQWLLNEKIAQWTDCHYGLIGLSIKHVLSEVLDVQLSILYGWLNQQGYYSPNRQRLKQFLLQINSDNQDKHPSIVTKQYVLIGEGEYIFCLDQVWFSRLKLEAMPIDAINHSGYQADTWRIEHASDEGFQSTLEKPKWGNHQIVFRDQYPFDRRTLKKRLMLAKIPSCLRAYLPIIISTQHSDGDLISRIIQVGNQSWVDGDLSMKPKSRFVFSYKQKTARLNFDGF